MFKSAIGSEENGGEKYSFRLHLTPKKPFKSVYSRNVGQALMLFFQALLFWITQGKSITHLLLLDLQVQHFNCCPSGYASTKK